MNPFWSEPDSLHAELDIRTPEDPEVLARIAREWIEAGVQGLAGDQVQALLAAPALTHRSLARHQGAFGDPGTPWGSLVVEPDERKRQASLHAWTPQTWVQFLAAAETNPRRMEVVPDPAARRRHRLGAGGAGLGVLPRGAGPGT